jgi:hypothetical protein
VLPRTCALDERWSVVITRCCSPPSEDREPVSVAPALQLRGNGAALAAFVPMSAAEVLPPGSAEAALVRICNLQPSTATLLVHGRLPNAPDVALITWGTPAVVGSLPAPCTPGAASGGVASGCGGSTPAPLASAPLARQ